MWQELTKLTLLSMTSLSLLRSSSAVSQFCMRISDPSFPQRAFKVFLSSLPGTCAETKYHWLDKTPYWHNCMYKILKNEEIKWGMFKMYNSQAHDKSTNTLRHQSSFHTHIEILHICTVCPTFLAWSANKQTNRHLFTLMKPIAIIIAIILFLLEIQPYMLWCTYSTVWASPCSKNKMDWIKHNSNNKCCSLFWHSFLLTIGKFFEIYHNLENNLLFRC